VGLWSWRVVKIARCVGSAVGKVPIVGETVGVGDNHNLDLGRLGMMTDNGVQNNNK